jgi:hypothetical protein
MTNDQVTNRKKFPQFPIWSALDWKREQEEQLDAIERYRVQSEQATKEERQ